jgi:hypothetical protein
MGLRNIDIAVEPANVDLDHLELLGDERREGNDRRAQG